jgi:hypothetical protein
VAAPHEKLAESLAELAKLQTGGKRVFRSDELSRAHRERLLRAGFLRQAVRGWLIASSPATAPGDSTPWSPGIFTETNRNYRHPTPHTEAQFLVSPVAFVKVRMQQRNHCVTRCQGSLDLYLPFLGGFNIVVCNKTRNAKLERCFLQPSCRQPNVTQKAETFPSSRMADQCPPHALPC